MSSPRKFSEKIAIMERKLNEDEDAFSKVMGEVRAITGNAAGCPVQQQQQPQSIVSPTLEPGQWNRPGGSLPNMYEPSQQYWPDPTRGRSPGSHYHPYRVPRGHDRVPPLHGHLHYQQMGPPQHLIPPNDQWNMSAFLSSYLDRSARLLLIVSSIIHSDPFSHSTSLYLFSLTQKMRLF